MSEDVSTSLDTLQRRTSDRVKKELEQDTARGTEVPVAERDDQVGGSEHATGLEGATCGRPSNKGNVYVAFRLMRAELQGFFESLLSITFVDHFWGQIF